jgi:S-formylglutathione hydrolase FrmB
MKRYLLIFAAFIGFTNHMFSQHQFVFESENLLKSDTVLVFTPENYNANNSLTYPLVYLLHGWSGNYHQWDNIIDCQTYADKYGFIIVCPDGLYDSWYLNSPVENENQYEDFFVDELWPFILKDFKVEKDNIFITGLSMGGHGALYLFEKHPLFFKSAGSLSGLLDLKLWQNHYGINKVLGLNNSTDDKEILNEYSVIGNIDKIKSSRKAIILSCGTEDPFYKINTSFVEECHEKGIEITFFEKPGNHNGDFWGSSIDNHFKFFKKLIIK